MIKAIIFDTGGILVKEIGKEAREMIANKFNFSSDDFSKVFMKYLSYSYAGWHYNAFFKKMTEELKLKVSYEELADEWLKIREETSSINEGAKKLIIELRKRFVVGFLSNSTILNEKVSARRNIVNLFDKDLRLLSFEIGFYKPDKEAYKILVSKLKEKNILPGETIFIDGKEENLVPAKEFGMKVILYKSENQLEDELKNLGVGI